MVVVNPPKAGAVDPSRAAAPVRNVTSGLSKRIRRSPTAGDAQARMRSAIWLCRGGRRASMGVIGGAGGALNEEGQNGQGKQSFAGKQPSPTVGDAETCVFIGRQ